MEDQFAFSDSYSASCEIQSNESLLDQFNTQCRYKKKCDFTYEVESWAPECQGQTFMVVSCQGQDIDVNGWFTMSRTHLTQLVILLDSVVVLSFVVYIIAIKARVKKEVDFYDLETVSIEDFAIQVKGIPPKSVYKHKTNLRAMLTAHFEKIVANQPQEQQSCDQRVQ